MKSRDSFLQNLQQNPYEYFCTAEMCHQFLFKKNSYALHAVQYDYKISAGLDTVIFGRRG
jgi:hypothetical protein